MTVPFRTLPMLALAAAGLWAAPLAARTVAVGPEETVAVRARVRFATAVVLPPEETILDWVCGDAEYWSVQGAANLAFVKPSAEGLRTNVTLVTDRGQVYTLLFAELGDAEGDPDLKVVLRPRGSGGAAAAAGEPEPDGLLRPLRFASHAAVRDAAREAAEARERARAAQEAARAELEAGLDAFRAEYPATLRFDYELERRAAAPPFGVRAMWRDGRFTYIAADPEEAPALYEERDGEPSLVPYDFLDGLYVARRELSAGWLQLGKRRLRFRRRP